MYIIYTYVRIELQWPFPIARPDEVLTERGDRGVEAQCLYQHPPSALSQAIKAKVGRRKRGVEAQ